MPTGDFVKVVGDNLEVEVLVVGVRAGGLIRVVGDKFEWEVRASFLKTLGILLDKGQAAMKPFVPSLQTLFRNFLSEQVCISHPPPHTPGIVARLRP